MPKSDRMKNILITQRALILTDTRALYVPINFKD